MIIGTVEIDEVNQLLHAGYTTYRLDSLKVAEAPRRYLGSAVVVSVLLTLFGASFHEILYVEECAAIAGLVAISLFVGWKFTFLSFHSRDLAGGAITGALYGTHGDLNMIRRKAMAVQTQPNDGSAP